MKNSKKSSSSAPVTAPIVTVAGSELDVVANSNYLAYLKANVAAARLMGQQANDGLDDPNDDPVNDPDDDPDDGTGDDPSEGNDRPSLSDIEIVSNEVVFDSAGIPSAKIIFKVKNSSGKVLTAIHSRVEKK
ncbi:MAG: hypothetical protein ACOYKR_08390 [Sphingobacterium thalpophilum]